VGGVDDVPLELFSLGESQFFSSSSGILKGFKLFDLGLFVIGEELFGKDFEVVFVDNSCIDVVLFKTGSLNISGVRETSNLKGGASDHVLNLGIKSSELIVEPESELVEEVSVLVLGVWDDLEVLLNVVLGNLRVVVEALNFTLEVISFSLDISLEGIELVLEESGKS
jgi:hypothetical protein